MRMKTKPTKIIFTTRPSSRVRPIVKANRLHIWQKNLIYDEHFVDVKITKDWKKKEEKYNNDKLKGDDKTYFYFGNNFIDNFTYNSFSIILYLRKTMLKEKIYETD